MDEVDWSHRTKRVDLVLPQRLTTRSGTRNLFCDS